MSSPGHQLDIPQDPPTHAEASRLVARAYEMEQQSRALHFWAHRQLSNAEKNVNYTLRRLRIAEQQVKEIVEAIEGAPQYRVVQYEPRGVRIMPYVVEQDAGQYQQSSVYETT